MGPFLAQKVRLKHVTFCGETLRCSKHLENKLFKCLIQALAFFSFFINFQCQIQVNVKINIFKNQVGPLLKPIHRTLKAPIFWSLISWITIFQLNKFLFLGSQESILTKSSFNSFFEEKQAHELQDKKLVALIAQMKIWSLRYQRCLAKKVN